MPNTCIYQFVRLFIFAHYRCIDERLFQKERNIFGCFFILQWENAFHAINNCVFSPALPIEYTVSLLSLSTPSLCKMKMLTANMHTAHFILITKWLFIQLSFEQTMIILIALLDFILRKWAFVRPENANPAPEIMESKWYIWTSKQHI